MRLLKKGRFQEAIDHSIQKVDPEKRPVRYHKGLARAYALIGDDIQAEKEYKNALGYINRKSRKELKLSDFDVMDELALLSVRIGNWQQVKALVSRSLQLRVRWWRKNDPVNFRPYLPLGMLHFNEGSIDSAKYYLNTFKDNIRFSNYTSHLDVDQYADVFQVLADIAAVENDLRLALHLAKKSARLQRHVWTKKEVGKNYADRVKALNTLAWIYIQKGDFKEGEKIIIKADRMLASVRGNLLLNIDTHLIKSRLEYQKENISESKHLIMEAMQLQIEFVQRTFIYLSEYEKENIYPKFKSNSDRILSRVYDLYKNEYISDHDPVLAKTLDYIINTKA
ncbi:MAG: hypothetical protein AAF843_05240, partial [Bacteroidota bacterium]